MFDVLLPKAEQTPCKCAERQPESNNGWTSHQSDDPAHLWGCRAATHELWATLAPKLPPFHSLPVANVALGAGFGSNMLNQANIILEQQKDMTLGPELGWQSCLWMKIVGVSTAAGLLGVVVTHLCWESI